MDEKELKALMEGIAEKNSKAIQDAVKAAVDSAVAGFITSKELGDELEKAGLKDGAIKMLTEAVEKQGVELAKMMQSGQKQNVKSIDKVLEENLEGIKKSFNERNYIHRMTVDKALTLRSAVDNPLYGEGWIDPVMGTIQWKTGKLYDLFRKIAAPAGSGGTIKYKGQKAVTNAAAETAEGASKPEATYTWEWKYLPIEKVAVSTTLTMETVDYAWLRADVDALMNRDLMLRINGQLYTGDGSTPNIKGLYTYAGAFSNTNYAAKVTDPNLFDLAYAVSNSIVNIGGGKYMPNFVAMNPVDIYMYDVQKAADGHYILPPFVSSDGKMIKGLSVIEDANVTVNTMVVGDTNYASIVELGGIELSTGYVNTQFVENEFTLLAEKRMAFYIKDQDVTGFKKVTDIAAAIAALQVP